MAKFSRFRPAAAAKLTSSQVESAEAYFEDHLDKARYAILGVINNLSQVGGINFTLNFAQKKQISVTLDWGRGYVNEFIFKGNFKTNDSIIATGKLRSISGIYKYSVGETGLLMSKIKDLSIDKLILEDVDANSEETIAQLNKKGKLIGHDDQDDEFDLQLNMFDDWLMPKVYGLGGDDDIQASYDSCTLSKSQSHYFNGGDGNDTIVGSAGNDKIIGGKGTNYLTGGCGKDSFYLSFGGTQVTADFEDEDILIFKKIGGKSGLSYDQRSNELSKNGEVLAIIDGLTADDYL